MASEWYLSHSAWILELVIERSCSHSHSLPIARNRSFFHLWKKRSPSLETTQESRGGLVLFLSAPEACQILWMRPWYNPASWGCVARTGFYILIWWTLGVSDTKSEIKWTYSSGRSAEQHIFLFFYFIFRNKSGIFLKLLLRRLDFSRFYLFWRPLLKQLCRIWRILGWLIS